MPRNTAGKWVARAGATGGGRTYRGQRPVNWYAALVIIVVLGILSILFAGYEYRHPAAASTTKPDKGTTWYAGLAFDVCGTQAPSLASNAASTTSKQAFFTSGKGVITIAPKTTAETGSNAVFGKFVSAYGGLKVTSSALVLPTSTTTTASTTTTTAAGKASATTTYTNGEACPKGTPDAGKKGSVKLVYWANAFNSKGKAVAYSGEPADLKFTENQLITVGFVPSGTTLPKPNGTVVKALVSASTGAATTSVSTTTAPGTTTPTTTVAPSATTPTTAPTTATTTAKNKQ
ncbi:MAG TPA: hypothetical protein VGG23_10670 [Acidimicrobiales bacterium]